MRRAIIRISSKFLAEALDLPVGHKIIDVIRDQVVHGYHFDFVVEGPEMPEVNEGDLYLKVNLIHHEARTEFEV